MGTDKQAKKLEQIRALLAKADATTFEGEAAVFRAKADELMTQYAIDQWMLRSTDKEAAIIQKKHFAFEWYATSPRKNELWDLFTDVAFHCRCSVVLGSWTHYFEGQRADRITVVGLESDLAWMDELFTHLLLQLAKELEPKPDPHKSLPENVTDLKHAGLTWKRITELVGMQEEWMPDGQNVNGKAIAVYKTYCRINGIEQRKVYPSVWQRSVAYGFVKTIKRRLEEMRRDQEERQDGARGGNSMALVVRDIREQVNDFMQVEFNKDQLKGKSISRSSRVDLRGVAHGRKAGSEANITNSADQRISTRKEISR